MYVRARERACVHSPKRTLEECLCTVHKNNNKTQDKDIGVCFAMRSGNEVINSERAPSEKGNRRRHLQKSLGCDGGRTPQIRGEGWGTTVQPAGLVEQLREALLLFFCPFFFYFQSPLLDSLAAERHSCCPGGRGDGGSLAEGR